GGARPQGLGGGVLHGLCAVRDDPDAGLGLAKGPDRSRSAEPAAIPPVPRAEVDYGDVEVADRGQELERSAPVLRFLHLVAAAERLSHAQADRGVRVYDQAASVLVHSPDSGQRFSAVTSASCPRVHGNDQSELTSPSRPGSHPSVAATSRVRRRPELASFSGAASSATKGGR